MKQIKFKLNALTAFDIKDDPLIKAFMGISSGEIITAYNSYSEICSILLKSNKTLGNYLHDILVFSYSPVVEAYLRDNNELQKKAICFDLRIIKELADMTSFRIKNELCEKFNDQFALELPDYENGEFYYIAEYFIDHVRHNGSGDYAKYKAFAYENLKLMPIESYDPIRLCELKKYETQRKQVIENTQLFISGKPAENVLLYGDRGTGKSSTIKALLNEYELLRIVQIDKSEICNLFKLYDILERIPLKFIIFIDDLSFSEDDDGFNILKQVLDGSLVKKPDNVLIYATTNRRHIIKETNAGRDADAVHRADAIDDNMSLSDRFGLFVTFSTPGKELYLEIIRQIARDKMLAIDDDKLMMGAERFALKRGGRSPRIAKQYVETIQSRLEMGLEI